MTKRIYLHWIFALGSLAWLADMLLWHPSNVYLCDPFSSTVLISLAISAAATAASAGIEYLAAKKQKASPVDRGKQDDVRISVPGYGEAIIKGWGTFRCAPVWFWHTPIVHTTVTTPGQSGGKGPPKPPTPDTVDHIYTMSLAGVFHDGLIYKGVSRIWFDSELVYNANFADNFAATATTKYEAEHGVLAGGASVAAQAECSGGNKVTGLGSGGNVTIHVDVSATASYEVAVHYTSTVERTFKVSVNGGGTTDLVCPASGAASIVAIQTITLSLTSGANTIKFENSGAACPDLDFIDIAPKLSFTNGEDRRSFSGLIDPHKVVPTDPDVSWPSGNEIPTFSDSSGGVTNGGFYSTTLAKWGQPQIRIYPGSETQEQDPAIVADKGAANTPAYRGFAYLVIEGLQLQNGRIPNVTVEVQQGTREASIITQDIYETVGIARTSVDVTALQGAVLGDSTGFDPGIYSAISWTGASNATGGAGGAITKTSGTDNTWNAYANSGDSISAGTDAAIRFTASAGTFMIGFATTSTPGSTLPHPYDQVPFGVLLNLNSNPSQESKNAIQMSLGGSNNSSDVGTWAIGDRFQVEIRNGRFAAYQNGLLLTGFSPPVPSYPLIPIFVGYHTGGGVSAASYASGTNIGSEPVIVNAGGLVLASRRSAADLITELQTRFQFDIPEVDGVVKCVLRNGSSELTINYSELRAHNDGEKMPEYDCLIADIDPLLLPFEVNVNYQDPQLDYHNNTQSDMRLIGPQSDSQSVSLSLVESADNMKKLATVLLYKPEREGRTFKFSTGPKYMRLHQGTVITLDLLNADHVVRITDAKYGLPAGVCEFEAVRQEASLYSPNGNGAISSGLEAPIAAISGNTRGVLLDAPVVEPENAGEQGQPVIYAAMSGTGSGSWPGGFLYREFPAGSGNYELLTFSDKRSAIGVAEGFLPTVVDFASLDATALPISSYSEIILSSVTESELNNNPKLNLMAFVTTNGVEYVQFKNAVPSTAIAPYISRYFISGFLRGRFETESHAGSHAYGETIVLMDSTVKVLPMPLTQINISSNYRFVTSGQSVEDAASIAFTWQGRALTPRAISDLTVTQGGVSEYLISFVSNARAIEQPASFAVDIYDLTGATMYRSMGVFANLATAAILTMLTPPHTGEQDVINNNVYGVVGVAYAGSGETVAAESEQEITDTFTFVEGEMTDVSGAEGAIELGVYQPGDIVNLANMDYGFRYSESGAALHIIVNGSSVASFDNSSSLYVGQGQRQSIRFSGSEVRFYLDYRLGKQPLYIAPGPATFPMKVGATAGYKTSIKGITISTSRVTTIYSESQQTADFGAAAGSFRLKAYQKARQPGFPDGIITEMVVQSAGGLVLLESGSPDNLLTESSDNLLKE